MSFFCFLCLTRQKAKTWSKKTSLRNKGKQITTFLTPKWSKNSKGNKTENYCRPKKLKDNKNVAVLPLKNKEL